MNIQRHVFNENVKDDLLHFLKVADEAKSELYCDFEKHKQMQRLFPLSSQIKKDFQTYIENVNICIDITESDDEMECSLIPPRTNDDNKNIDEINNLSLSYQNINEVNTEDIIDSIKDSLSTQNEVSNLILKDISKMDVNGVNKIFSLLANQISIEGVEILWSSLTGFSSNEYVVLAYIRFLFLPKVQKEFTYELQKIFLSLSQKFPTFLKNELVRLILETDSIQNGTNSFFQQYIGTLQNEFKTEVLRQFVYSCENLHLNYIPLTETLLNPQTDCDILSKLIEVMSNAATEFSSDNTYGRLLFNVVNQLEKDMSRVEQPLKHILGVHTSIWKMKVEKVVGTWLNDTLTQSFV